MPILDMSLEKLKVYRGVNPRPDDFDEFWDDQLAKMRALDPKVELIPAKFKSDIANCYDMYFTGTKESRIHAKLLIPKNIEGKMPAVLNFHGYSGESGAWSSYLGYAGSGFVVAALDSRGQGGLSEDGGKIIGNTLRGFITRGLLNEDVSDMYYVNAFLDTALLAKIVMEMECVDEERVGAYGGSQGGALTIACAALEPRIKKAAPCYPFLTDYKRTWDMDLDKDAYEDLRIFFRKFDPMHEKEEFYFTKLGYIDLQFLAPRIKADLIMFTGLLDNICPPSTQFAAYNKMTCKKEVKIFPDFGHESVGVHNDLTYEFLMELKK